MTNVLDGYLQSLGADIYHAIMRLFNLRLIAISALQFIVIIGVISGVGLIGYDVYFNRKKKPNVKELAEEVRKHRKKKN
ncbi:MAG: hypothetical protein DLM72_17895 [Candidatus Nitrosopolaris wilkensis]|nr:MAG: hypothetical protein DLM72_17895 [Candidatus Nitrosopolaris wilkensis]